MCSSWVCPTHFSPTEEAAYSQASKLPDCSDAGTICLGLVGSLYSNSESCHLEDRSLLRKMKAAAGNEEVEARGSLAPESLAELTIISYDKTCIMVMVAFLVITFY